MTNSPLCVELVSELPTVVPVFNSFSETDIILIYGDYFRPPSEASIYKSNFCKSSTAKIDFLKSQFLPF